MRVWSILGVLVKGHREAVGLLVGGGMALLCGLIFAIVGVSSLVREYEFMTNSTTGIAEVIGKGRTGQKDFFVDCRLLSFAGANHYEKRIPVYSGLWQNLRKGQALNVDYLRNDPANMRLQGSIGNLGDAFLHLLIGTMLAVIGIVVSPIAIQFLVRQNRERKADE